MNSAFACANCGSIRTSTFHGDHLLSCIRCDDCGYSEYRDTRDFYETEEPAEAD